GDDVRISFSEAGSVPARVAFWYRPLVPKLISPAEQAEPAAGWTYTGLHFVNVQSNELILSRAAIQARIDDGDLPPFDPQSELYEIATAVFDADAKGYVMPFTINFAPQDVV